MQMLDALHALAAMPVATTPIRMRLTTAVGSVTAAGTELASGGGYVNGTGLGPVTFGSATSPGNSATTVAVAQTNMPAATITSIELWDSNATAVRQEVGNLASSKITAAGDTLSFAIAAVTSALTGTP